jgi:hypothetical protein
MSMMLVTKPMMIVKAKIQMVSLIITALFGANIIDFLIFRTCCKANEKVEQQKLDAWIVLADRDKLFEIVLVL